MEINHEHQFNDILHVLSICTAVALFSTSGFLNVPILANKHMLASAVTLVLSVPVLLHDHAHNHPESPLWIHFNAAH